MPNDDKVKFLKDNLAKARHYKFEGNEEKAKEFAIEEFRFKLLREKIKMAELILKEFNIPVELVKEHVISVFNSNRKKGRHEIHLGLSPYKLSISFSRPPPSRTHALRGYAGAGRSRVLLHPPADSGLRPELPVNCHDAGHYTLARVMGLTRLTHPAQLLFDAERHTCTFPRKAAGTRGTAAPRMGINAER